MYCRRLRPAGGGDKYRTRSGESAGYAVDEIEEGSFSRPGVEYRWADREGPVLCGMAWK